MAQRIDIEPGTEYLLPFAKKKLEQMKRDTPALVNKRIYATSGEEIFIQQGFVDLIRIRGAGGVAGVIVPMDRDAGFWPSSMAAIDIAAFGGPGALGLPGSVPTPAPFSLVYKHGKVVVTSQADKIAMRLAMLKRALGRNEFDLAEGLVRNIDDDGATVTDGALHCDEGFFVDLALYTGRPFYADLARVVQRYARTLNHDPAPPITATFAAVDLAQFQPTVLNEDAKRFLFGATPLPGTNWANDGTALINSGIVVSSTDVLPVGARITGQVASIASPTTTFAGDHRWQDMLAVSNLQFSQYYYDVTASNFPSAGFSGSHSAIVDAPTSGGAREGPISGYRICQGRRVRQRRTPTGWVTVSDTAVTPTTIQAFTMNGNDPPFNVGPSTAAVVTPPAAAESVDCALDTDGVLTTITQLTYAGADVRYTYGPDKLARANVNLPTGTYPGGGIYAAHSAIVQPAASTAPLLRFVRGDLTFTWTVTNVVRVVDSHGTLVLSVPPPATAPVLVPRVEMVTDYNFVDTGAYATYKSTARVNVALQVYGPAAVTRDIIVPPSAQDQYCIYSVADRKVLYFAANVSSPSDALLAQIARFAFATALAVRAQHLVEATFGDALIADARARMMSYVRVLANTGIPEDCLVFTVPTPGLATVLL